MTAPMKEPDQETSGSALGQFWVLTRNPNILRPPEQAAPINPTLAPQVPKW